MTTWINIEDAQQELTDLVRMARSCEAIAQALAETRRPWISSSVFMLLMHPTEYERSRGRVMQACRDLIIKVRRLQRETRHPELIRVRHDLTRMLLLCQRCIKANRQHLKRTAPFTCLLHAEDTEDVGGVFRYRLDERGQIIEH